MLRVLRSHALSRSEQLRAFLRYVCEAEFAGRSQELNEYALGVAALGRPEGYSPAEDSCVRSRAYELRNKLKTYYGSESPDEPVRIEIAKGGYAPRFVRASSVSRPTHDVTLQSADLQALWEPFLKSEAPLLIVFDVRLFFYAPETGLVVRHYLTNEPSDVLQSEPLRNFQHGMHTSELQERRDYADFGAVHTAFSLGRLLAGRRYPTALKHSHALDWQDIWNSNVVFIGKAETSPVVASLLRDLPFFDRNGTIFNVQPEAGEAAEYHCASTHGVGEKHALISRVPSPQSGRHMLLLTGAGAELIWALGESVTNPNYAKEFMPHVLVAPGHAAETFQVVIRAEFQANVPVRIVRTAHRVVRAAS